MDDVQPVADAIRANDRFVTTAHENPDGDALGSLLGMTLALRSLGKDVVMFLAGSGPLPGEYRFLELDDLVRERPTDVGERVLLALDCANESRIGTEPDLIRHPGLDPRGEFGDRTPQFGFVARGHRDARLVGVPAAAHDEDTAQHREPAQSGERRDLEAARVAVPDRVVVEHGDAGGERGDEDVETREQDDGQCRAESRDHVRASWTSDGDNQDLR